jgi:hypothetical protein
MRRSPDLIADHIVADTNRNQRVRVGSGLVKASDIPSIIRTGVLFLAIALWCFALRINGGRENLWSYILPMLALGGFIGAGIGFYQFGGHALGLTDRNAKLNA